MNKFQKKFGRFAIPNLTLVIIFIYLFGYIIQLAKPQLLDFMTLDPALILKGQVWRLVSWIIIPPSTMSIQTLILDVILLLFIYSIGTTMEHTLGTWRYNVYVWTGVLLTIIASFVLYGYFWIKCGYDGYVTFISFEVFMAQGYALLFNTYYVMLSVLLAYCVCYPNHMVYLMFVIPVKMKWLGIMYLILMVYEIAVGNIFSRAVMAASLLNFVIFYFRYKNLSHLKPKEIKRRSEFKQQVRHVQKTKGHKCSICERTDEEYPELEFRYCSKCVGNHEFCQDHLFTHQHFKE